MSNQESSSHNPIKYLTTSQVVEIVGFNDTSLKRYLNNHSDFIDWKMVGRQYRINADSIPIIQQVRKLYENNYQRDEIEEFLHNEGTPVTITVDNKDTEDNKPIISLNEDIKDVRTLLHQQLRENEQLKQDINELKETSEDIHDELLKNNEQVKQELEEVKELSASLLKEFKELKESSEESKDKSWWSRLFNK